ncbi:hypothetical protein HK096_005066 [Nowakowskiella sp. JEL0078]|nr:hypothetical protein HK096_005066 [Nowakowskiella sp. JEL0078]
MIQKIELTLACIFGAALTFLILNSTSNRNQSAGGDLHGHCNKKIAAERIGRINAEKALRKGVVEKISMVGYPLLVIGTVMSPFLARRGTPRQGLLVPDSRAFIKLNTEIPCETLQGLDGYSHLFVHFLFHENTNLAKTVLATQSGQDGLNSRASSSKSSTFSSRVASFAAKVLPPLLNGKSIGLFATRSPHRPNALGLSLVRVLSVDVEQRLIVVAGADLVDGTPVVDLKPWGPFDCPTCLHLTADHEGVVPCMEASNRCSLFNVYFPDWVEFGLKHPYTLPVEWNDAAKNTLEELVETEKTKFYSKGESLIMSRAITQMLSLDIRSNHRGRGKGPEGKDVASDLIVDRAKHAVLHEQEYELEFDVLHIQFTVRKGVHKIHKDLPWISIDSIHLNQ